MIYCDTQFCTHCQKNVPTYTDIDRYNGKVLVRTFCGWCNREIYNQTETDKILKLKNYPKRNMEKN
jgi:hypothetical protein